MFRTTLIAATLSIAFAGAHAAQPLQVKVYNADGNSFNVNSTLVYGEKEAMVIDLALPVPTRCASLPTCLTAARNSKPST